MAWSAPVAPPSAPTPQLVTATVRGLRRYWWLILGLWPVLSIGACAVIYTRIQPLYESESMLRIQDRNNIYDGGRNEDLAVFQDTMVQLILGSNVLTKAKSAPEMIGAPRILSAPDAVAELRNSLLVRAIRGTYLIAVGAASRDPNEAATIVNTVVDAFLDENRSYFENLNKKQTDQLESTLASLDQKSATLQARWKELARNGDPLAELESIRRRAKTRDVEAKDADTAITMTIDQFHRVQEQYRELQLELASAESYLGFIQEKKPEPQMTEEDKQRLVSQITQTFLMEPDTIALQNQLYELKSRLDGILRTTREGYSDPAAARQLSNMNRLRAQYENLWARRKEQIREQLLDRKTADPVAEIKQAQAKINELRARKAVMEREIDSLRLSNSSVSGQVVEVAIIQDELDTLARMKDTITRRLADLSYAAKDSARIFRDYKAEPAGRPRADSRMKYMAMTPIGVLGAVLCLVIALELRSARVSDPESLSIRLRHEVFPIAPLPNIRPGQDGRAPRAEQKLARFVQSLDHLRVALCEGGVPGQGRCVLITSATGGEGKTTLSAHLAARCANAGTSILLIDADMRRASLGRLLDVAGGPGLADVLSGDVPLAEAIRPVQAGGFAFLSAGTTDIDPSRILTSSRLSALVEQLRAMYDLVLIDSPPVLPVPDALLMGRHVDGVVMASRFDSSRLPMVERASRQLAAANIPVLGMVVNGARGHASAYDNYHYNYPHPGGRDEPETGVEPA